MLKMTKLCILFVLLGVLVLCGSAASAQGDTTLLRSDDTRYFGMPDTLYGYGTQVYILGSDGLYGWQDGQEDLSRLVNMEEEVRYFFQTTEPTDVADKAVWNRSLNMILGDADTLYGLHTGSGNVFIWKNAAFEPVVRLDLSSFIDDPEHGFSRDFSHPFVSQNFLYALVGPKDYSSSSRSIIAADLSTGSVRVLAEGPYSALKPYEHGYLLLQVEADNSVTPVALMAMDTDTGELAPIETATEGNIGGLCYNTNSDLLYYISNNEIRSIDGAGNLELAGFNNDEYVSSAIQGFALDNGTIAYHSLGNGIILSNSDPQKKASQILRIAGAQEVQREFAISHPDVQVVLISETETDIDSLIRAVTTNEDAADIYVVSISDGLNAMKEKGYTADLSSSSVLADYVATFYPQLQSVVKRGDAIIGFPYQLDIRPWMMDDEVWNALGLGEIPQNYAGFLNLIAESISSMSPDDNTRLVEIVPPAQALFQSLIEIFIVQCEQADEPLNFDTLAFREAAEAIKRIAIAESDTSDNYEIDMSEVHAALYTYSYSLGSRGSYDSVRWIVPPPVNQGGDPKVPATLKLYIVNPNSAELGNAIAYLECVAQNLDKVKQILYSPNYNEPVLDENWERINEDIQNQIALLEEQKAATDINQTTLDDDIRRLQNYLASYGGKWAVSEAEITSYRNVAPYMDFAELSLFMGSGQNSGFNELQGIAQQYLAGQLDTNRLIQQLNRISMMVYKEGS